MDKEVITLSRLAFVIGSNCNLRCKLCSVGVPYIREHFTVGIEEFRNGLANAFAFIDAVGSLEFGGGEPFLNKDLPRMIAHYHEVYAARFKQWLVVTNGLVPLGDALASAIEKHRENGVIHISDYGLSHEKIARLREQLDEIGIRYRVDKYWGEGQYSGGWIDPGDVARFHRDDKALSQIYTACGIVKNGGCWRIYRGKLHFCTRSSRCAEFGVDLPEDYIDLNDGVSAGARRDKLAGIIKRGYLSCCDYCKGDLGTKDQSKRYAAGEQL